MMIQGNFVNLCIINHCSNRLRVKGIRLSLAEFRFVQMIAFNYCGIRLGCTT